MAFMIHSTDDHRVPVLEYLPCAENSVQAGTLMTILNGKLMGAGGAMKPTYLCVAQRDSIAEDETIPVVRILPDMTLETTLTGNVEGITLGSKVTCSTGGAGISGVSDSGVIEVVYAEGSTAGSVCRVRVP